MIYVRRFQIASFTCFVGTISLANAASFPIRPITFEQTTEYSIVATGTVTTEDATNTVTGWNATVTTSSRLAHFTPTNTANMSFGEITCDGTHLMVATSPDGFEDGGILYFRSPNPFLDIGVAVADFTGLSASGGQAMYMYGGSFDWAQLDQPNGAQYIAATRSIGNVYILTKVEFFGGVTLRGEITTDGTIGLLTPNHITGWSIYVDQVTEDLFTSDNSVLIDDLVDLDLGGSVLTVFNPDGYLTFSKGSVGGHPYALTLADFSAQAPPGGRAGYFQGNFGVTTIELHAPPGPWPVTDGSVSAVVESGLELGPEFAALGPPLPNPSRRSVSVELAMARAGNHRVRVVDSSGRWVTTLFDGRAAAGAVLLRWDGIDAAGRTAPSGVYFLELDGRGVDSRRFVLIR